MVRVFYGSLAAVVVTILLVFTEGSEAVSLSDVETHRWVPRSNLNIRACLGGRTFQDKLRRPRCSIECYNPGMIYDEMIQVLTMAKKAHLESLRCRGLDGRGPPVCDGLRNCDELDDKRFCVKPAGEAAANRKLTVRYNNILKRIASNRMCSTGALGGTKKLCITSAGAQELWSYVDRRVFLNRQNTGPFKDNETSFSCHKCRTLPYDRAACGGGSGRLSEADEVEIPAVIERMPTVSAGCSGSCNSAADCAAGCTTADKEALLSHYGEMVGQLQTRIEQLEETKQGHIDDANNFVQEAAEDAEFRDHHLRRRDLLVDEAGEVSKIIDEMSESGEAYRLASSTIRSQLEDADSQETAVSAGNVHTLPESDKLVSIWAGVRGAKCSGASVCGQHRWYGSASKPGCNGICAHKMCFGQAVFWSCVQNSYYGGYTLELCHLNSQTRPYCFNFN